MSNVVFDVVPSTSISTHPLKGGLTEAFNARSLGYYATAPSEMSRIIYDRLVNHTR